MPREIVIIGSGAAGITAASSAKMTDPCAKVTVFTEDTDIAYSPCAIPWAIEGKIAWEKVVMHTPEHYSKEGIDIFTQTRVEAVDGFTKTVTAAGNIYRYDTLVIASGGRAFIPPIWGANLDGAFVVRTVRDGKNIQSYLSKGVKRVVVCGAGTIGLEMAVAFLNLGKKVTVIEMLDQVMPRIADKDMADMIQKHLERKGIDLRI
jgi:NADH oxidase (H2O2-forming)